MGRGSGDGVGFERSIVVVPFLMIEMMKGEREKEEKVPRVRMSPKSVRYKQAPPNPSAQKYTSTPLTPSPSKKAHYHSQAGIYPQTRLSATSHKHVTYNPFLQGEKGG